STSTPGASIRYTTDDSTPSSSAGTLYSGPIGISASTVVKAVAFKSGMAASALTVSPYTIDDTRMSVTRGGYVLNRRTNQITQQVTLKNVSAQTVSGPIYLVLDALSGNTTLANSAGTTGGAPYVVVSAGSLAPGASVSVTLLFANPASGG